LQHFTEDEISKMSTEDRRRAADRLRKKQKRTIRFADIPLPGVTSSFVSEFPTTATSSSIVLSPKDRTIVEPTWEQRTSTVAPAWAQRMQTEINSTVADLKKDIALIAVAVSQASRYNVDLPAAVDQRTMARLQGIERHVELLDKSVGDLKTVVSANSESLISHFREVRDNLFDEPRMSFSKMITFAQELKTLTPASATPHPVLLPSEHPTTTSADIPVSSIQHASHVHPEAQASKKKKRSVPEGEDEEDSISSNDFVDSSRHPTTEDRHHSSKKRRQGGPIHVQDKDEIAKMRRKDPLSSTVWTKKSSTR
jgi:hypothetical protein